MLKQTLIHVCQICYGNDYNLTSLGCSLVRVCRISVSRLAKVSRVAAPPRPSSLTDLCRSLMEFCVNFLEIGK